MVVKKTVEKVEPTKALAKPAFHTYTDEELKGITTFEDAMALSASIWGDTVDIRDMELGNGFKVTRDKEMLLGKPFLILQSQFWMGDYSEFASMMIVTRDGGDKVITNDGGTGVCRDLKQMIAEHSGRNGGFYVPFGYRKSAYSCCPECGLPLKLMDLDGEITECGQCGKTVGQKRQPGATYYFDFSEDRVGR